MPRPTPDTRRRPAVLSIIVPAFNEERSIARCLERVFAIAGSDLALEVIVVDDASTDRTKAIVEQLARRRPGLRLASHARNRGKGAALHTGFRLAAGDFVAVQDADLEYDPRDLRRLMQPLLAGDADVVIGSRFLGDQPHRVLYFWHSVGNRVLTLLSNMFTDLNLTDMETCYKVFRRDLLQHLDLREERFGFEPEVVAQLARLRPRIYEMGVSYVGRTYAEGKKIGMKDGFRALYCIARYNLPHAPLPVQAAGYLVVGSLAALTNLATFMAARQAASDWVAAPLAFVVAAVVNYLLCIALLFQRRPGRTRLGELAAYTALVLGVGAIDASTTVGLIAAAWSPTMAKTTASVIGLVFNFLGRRDVVFARPPVLTWAPADPLPVSRRPVRAAVVDRLDAASSETP